MALVGLRRSSARPYVDAFDLNVRLSQGAELLFSSMHRSLTVPCRGIQDCWTKGSSALLRHGLQRVLED